MQVTLFLFLIYLDHFFLFSHFFNNSGIIHTLIINENLMEKTDAGDELQIVILISLPPVNMTNIWRQFVYFHSIISCFRFSEVFPFIVDNTIIENDVQNPHSFRIYIYKLFILIFLSTLNIDVCCCMYDFEYKSGVKLAIGKPIIN